MIFEANYTRVLESGKVSVILHSTSAQVKQVKKKVKDSGTKVVNIETIRQQKRGKGSLRDLLHDTHQAAHAIQQKTCMLCHARKLCVNKTGLCASCYSELSPKEKQIADQEAQHKIIEVTVTDDRWNSENDT